MSTFSVSETQKFVLIRVLNLVTEELKNLFYDENVVCCKTRLIKGLSVRRDYPVFVFPPLI